MVLYFTGTGNSQYIASRIAEALNDELFSINDRLKSGDTSPVATGEALILVTPTYAWRIPRIVQDWLLKTSFPAAKRVWFIMDCGSETGNAAKFNRKLCQAKGLSYMGTAQILHARKLHRNVLCPSGSGSACHRRQGRAGHSPRHCLHCSRTVLSTAAQQSL